MADPLGSHFHGAFAGHLHQVNSTAWRVHFLAPQDVRWTGGKTETAMNAFLDDFERRRVVGVECGRGIWLRLAQMPPAKRPGFKVSRGSSCRFRARMTRSESPTALHASMVAACSGRCATKSEPPRDSISVRNFEMFAAKEL